MRNFQKWLVTAAAVMLAASIPPAAMAQVNSNAGTVILNATMPEALTVSVTGGGTVNFNLAPNTAAGSCSAGGALNSVTSGGAGVPAFITPAAATGVQIGSVAINGANKASSTTTTLTWNINTTGIPQLPANTYTGTVNIQAQATP
jgi:hypothetical protein